MNFQSKGLLAQANAGALPFPDDFFHAIITSPPYWPHRVYEGKRQDLDWPGMSFDPNPLHNYGVRVSAWTGPLGLEPDPVMFIAHIVYLCREFRRVLRDDGSFWLNYGDCFLKYPFGELKPQSLAMMPAQIVLALQADGWMLRNDNVWSKPDTTPEPRTGWYWERHRLKVKSAGVDWKERARSKGRVVDGPGNVAGGNTGTRGPRPEWIDCPGCNECEPSGYVLRRGSWRHTRAHEFVFHLTKGRQQWADHMIVQEPTSETSHGSLDAGAGQKQADLGQNQGTTSLGLRTATRNPRTVWQIPTSSFKGEHFATYPEDLILAPMLSSVPRKSCPHCGTGWSPIIERVKHATRDSEAQRQDSVDRSGRGDGFTQGPSGQIDSIYVSGYKQSCTCPPEDPVPGRVLDPFFGSGTTGMLAKKIGVDFVGVDVSHDYLSRIARIRAIGGTPPDALDGLPLFDGHS